ncbi:MAG: 30S ribosomal protein S4 [Patescibacteria group bacterium]|jgi:small subunit ribosomal protein S4|nr:30S ribosomal protein S4 [Patescibacteria group bacterium]
MAKIPKKKITKASRRYGVNLSQGEKNIIGRRSYPAGIHGPKRQGRPSEYGTQLREKQIARLTYGIMEKQFANYYKKAIAKKGDTGEILQQLLEMRLDNVIYRLGFAKTRRQARQMVNHGFFLVNNKRVTIPSYQVKPKDEITIKDNKFKSKLFEDLEKRLEKYQTPIWLHLDLKNRSGKVVNKPTSQEMEQTFNPRLIVEFYSK